MNKISIAQVGRLALLLSAIQMITTFGFAQVKYTGNTVDLVINGTSTLHDWDMKSQKADCSAVFQFNNSGQISGMNSMGFSTQSRSLKSDHSAMDNNAYKALKTDQNPSITFTLTSVNVSITGPKTSTLKCVGKLNIAGATKEEIIEAICKVNPDNSISVSGSSNISMKDFNMQPPTFMLGTVKTGNDIVLKFNLTLKKA